MGRSINHPEVNFVSLSRIVGCVEVISMHCCRNCIVIPAGLAVLLLLRSAPFRQIYLRLQTSSRRPPMARIEGPTCQIRSQTCAFGEYDEWLRVASPGARSASILRTTRLKARSLGGTRSFQHRA